MCSKVTINEAHYPIIHSNSQTNSSLVKQTSPMSMVRTTKTETKRRYLKKLLLIGKTKSTFIEQVTVLPIAPPWHGIQRGTMACSMRYQSG